MNYKSEVGYEALISDNHGTWLGAEESTVVVIDCEGPSDVCNHKRWNCEDLENDIQIVIDVEVLMWMWNLATTEQRANAVRERAQHRGFELKEGEDIPEFYHGYEF